MTQNAYETASPQNRPTTGSYADVNGLHLYYEIHGQGRPLVMIHGALATIDTSFGSLLPAMAETHQVIAMEHQAHGHTADIDRPATYAQMAEDTAALLQQLQIENADIYGYSMGSAVALELALRYPELVRKMVLAGGVSFKMEGLYPEMASGMEGLKAEDMAGSEWEAAYLRAAPRPEDFPKLIERVKQMDVGFDGWTAEQLKSLQVPVLLMIGDADIVRPEHVVEMFRLLGGGVPGDIYGLPRARLAILPGTTHIGVIHRSEWMAAMISEFLDTPA